MWNIKEIRENPGLLRETLRKRRMTIVPEEKTLRLLRELGLFLNETEGRLVREDPAVRMLRERPVENNALDEEETLRALDEEWRRILTELEMLRKQRNDLSKEVGRTEGEATREAMKIFVEQVKEER